LFIQTACTKQNKIWFIVLSLRATLVIQKTHTFNAKGNKLVLGGRKLEAVQEGELVSLRLFPSVAYIVFRAEWNGGWDVFA